TLRARLMGDEAKLPTVVGEAGGIPADPVVSDGLWVGPAAPEPAPIEQPPDPVLHAREYQLEAEMRSLGPGFENWKALPRLVSETRVEHGGEGANEDYVLEVAKRKFAAQPVKPEPEGAKIERQRARLEQRVESIMWFFGRKGETDAQTASYEKFY